VFAGETALVYGPLSVQSELYAATVDRLQGVTNNFYGGYAFVSYFLTGENRPYNRKIGTFDRVRPYQDFFRGRTPDGCISTGRGAWEVVYRFSYIDMLQGLAPTALTAGAGRAADQTVGLNWYLNPYTRIMFNYVHSSIAANVPIVDSSNKTIGSFRVSGANLDEFLMRIASTSELAGIFLHGGGRRMLPPGNAAGKGLRPPRRTASATSLPIRTCGGTAHPPAAAATWHRVCSPVRSSPRPGEPWSLRLSRPFLFFSQNRTIPCTLGNSSNWPASSRPGARPGPQHAAALRERPGAVLDGVEMPPGRWSRSLRSFSADAQSPDPVARRAQWPYIRGVMEEVLTGEILTRVWTALACLCDRQHGAQDAEWSPAACWPAIWKPGTAC